MWIKITIAGIFLILMLVLNRMLTVKSLRLLSDDEKERIINFIQKFKKYSRITMFVLLGVILLFFFIMPDPTKILMLVVFPAFILYLLIIDIITYINYKKLELPAQFMKYFILLTVIKIAGILIIYAVALSPLENLFDRIF